MRNVSLDCIVKGCRQKQYCKEMCEKHYRRTKKYGTPNIASKWKRLPTLEERIWQKINKSGPIVDNDLGPCWDWLGAPDKDGYGRIRTSKNSEPAFRVLYELLNGNVPAGLELDHLCNRNICVNPAHLDPVTPFVNNSRRHQKLDEEKIREIRSLYNRGVRKAELSRIYDVTFMTITYIVRRVTWDWVK